MSRHAATRHACARLSGICLLVASVFLLVACGGDDSDSTGAGENGGPALTKAQLISQAEAICKKGDAELNQSAQRAFSGKSATAAARARYATQTGIPIVERMVGRLGDLSYSPDDQRFRAILTAADQEIAAVKNQPGDFGDSAFTRTDGLAHAYGLPDC